MSGHIWKILVFSLLAMVCSCQNGGSGIRTANDEVSAIDSDSLRGPSIEFSSTEYDFGRVYEGEKVGWYFRYKNTGDKNLLLVNVSASCGCTIPDYSREPLPPGKEGTIKVIFDSGGRNGKQYKTVSVETNGEPRMTELTILAEIIKK